MSIKVLEKGIVEGDWDKVVKGFNALTGKKLKKPATGGKTPKVVKQVTKTKTVTVFKNEPSLLEALKFYAEKVNYKVGSSGIPVLVDGGSKASIVDSLATAAVMPEVDDDILFKKVKTKGKAKASNPDVIVVDIDEFKEKTNYLPRKKTMRRPPDNSKDIVQHQCSVCKKDKSFRRFEVDKSFGDDRMEVVCNGCISRR